jgi:DNA-binding NarL/FixJ family response regulator
MIATHPTIGLYASHRAKRGSLNVCQCEVAILVADGYCDKEIAKRLELAPSTIPRYVKRIAKRLGCDELRNSRIQITRAVIHAWSVEEEAAA